MLLSLNHNSILLLDHNSVPPLPYSAIIITQLTHIHKLSLFHYDCPIYATLPIAELARTLHAITNITPIRFNQPIPLTNQLKGYTLTAHQAATAIGNAFITITPSLPNPTTSLLYLPSFNHQKDHAFDPARFPINLTRFGTLVVDPSRINHSNIKTSTRDQSFLNLITTTLAANHSILLPTDEAQRLVELLVLLQIHWSNQKLSQPICLVAKKGREIITLLRTLTEYLGGNVALPGGESILKFESVLPFPPPPLIRN